MENLKDRLARAEQEIAYLRRELQKEEARGEEYASTEDGVGSATRKRKIQPPKVQSRSIHTCTAPPPKRSRIDDSSLMIDGNLRYFQSGGANFSQLLREKGQAYFDRTRYISVLTETNKHILFFRPRRFGKSLTVSMLDHFHGLQYTEEHQSFYEGLDVQKDMAEGKVKPGQYFILKFDFSTVERSPDVDAAARYLKMSISQTFEEFYNTYVTYLGEDAKTLIDPDSPALSLRRCVERVNSAIQKSGDESLTDIQGIYLLVDEYDAFSNDYLEPHRPTWEGTPVEATFKSFWSTVKSLLWNGIQRSFITGISPLSLTDIGSGYNVARNISFDEDVAGLCGLTRSDIQAALKTVCGPNSESYQKHLLSMTEYFNGYHFCDGRSVKTLYNTETCLSYLQRIIERKMPRIQDPPNSEVSEQFLKRFAASAVAVTDFQDALTCDEEGNFNLLQYDDLKQDFKLTDLGKDIDTSRSAWRSLMIYFGGLTFYSKDPANYLKIPNKIAAKRIAEAVLQRYGLSGSLGAALDFLCSNGDIQPVLSCYRDLMVQRDVGLSDFKKSEEIHRDSFYFSLLQNHSLHPRPEFKVIKANKASGRVDLLLQLQRYLIVTEWKVVRIDFLDIQVPGHQYPDQDTKVSALGDYTLSQILQLKFGHWDRFRPGQALKQWIEQMVAPQLKDYIRSDQVMQLVKDRSLVMRAHLVVVVGSRHILLWDMDSDGKLVSHPNLIQMRKR